MTRALPLLLLLASRRPRARMIRRRRAHAAKKAFRTATRSTRPASTPTPSRSSATRTISRATRCCSTTSVSSRSRPVARTRRCSTIGSFSPTRRHPRRRSPRRPRASRHSRPRASPLRRIPMRRAPRPPAPPKPVEIQITHQPIDSHLRLSDRHHRVEPAGSRPEADGVYRVSGEATFTKLTPLTRQGQLSRVFPQRASPASRCSTTSRSATPTTRSSHAWAAAPRRTCDPRDDREAALRQHDGRRRHRRAGADRHHAAASTAGRHRAESGCRRPDPTRYTTIKWSRPA